MNTQHSLKPTYVAQKFQHAMLKGIDFTSCDVAHADFSGADLSSANFRGVDCKGVKFTNAILRSTNFIGAKKI
ncbi:pentapeptide repeat-containing protein [Pseudomonas lini]